MQFNLNEYIVEGHVGEVISMELSNGNYTNSSLQRCMVKMWLICYSHKRKMMHLRLDITGLDIWMWNTFMHFKTWRVIWIFMKYLVTQYCQYVLNAFENKTAYGGISKRWEKLNRKNFGNSTFGISWSHKINVFIDDNTSSESNLEPHPNGRKKAPMVVRVVESSKSIAFILVKILPSGYTKLCIFLIPKFIKHPIF